MAGSSSYPGALDNFSESSPTNLGDNDATGRNHAKRHDDMETTMEAVQAELGVNPSGSDATVAARLAAIEAGTNIASGSITSAKIADGTIVTADLADSSVTSAKIVDGTITSTDLAPTATAAPFGGSVLVPVPDTPAPGEQLLKQAVWWIDAQASGSSDSAATNLGWGGTALNAAQGTTANQPKFLAFAGTPYVYIPGVGNNFLSTPDAADLRITGDIDIRVKLAMDDWTPSATQGVIGRWFAGNLSYGMTIKSTGAPAFTWSASGAAAVADVICSASTGFVDGSTHWVRVTMDVDDGAGNRVIKFYTSDDGSTWTQLGTTTTTAGTTSINAGTSELRFGAHGDAGFLLAGKLYRAQVLNGIGGTPVLDIDTSVIGSGAATSFNALTGQTVSVNRATSGRKSVCVVAPCWLFGTDDYLSTPDSDLLDFDATTSFTMLAVVREWATPGNNAVILSKRIDGGVGYSLLGDGTPFEFLSSVSDGVNAATTATLATTSGSSYTVAAVLDRTGQTLTTYRGVAATAGATTTSVGSLANTYSLVVGQNSSGTARNEDMEFVAAAVFRRALTAAEVQTISDYFTARVGG